MRNSRLRVLALLPLAMACTASQWLHAAEGSSVEERMSYKEFTGLGLDKLSVDQLRGLNEWLRTHSGAACAQPRVDSAQPAQATPSTLSGDGDRRNISSNIVGEFKGWHQGTVLRLANGQRWEVRDDEPLYASSEMDPKVTLEPGMLSGWTLSVAGHNEIAHVVPASAH